MELSLINLIRIISKRVTSFPPVVKSKNLALMQCVVVAIEITRERGKQEDSSASLHSAAFRFCNNSCSLLGNAIRVNNIAVSWLKWLDKELQVHFIGWCISTWVLAIPKCQNDSWIHTRVKYWRSSIDVNICSYRFLTSFLQWRVELTTLSKTSWC